jgi:dTDP-4-amino-4,6-dideoxygalactose transaminase
LYADITHARDLLGFEPQVGLQEGLEKLRDYYLSLGASPGELLSDERVANWESPGREDLSGIEEQKKIPVARPWLGEREAAAVRRPILSGWVTQGKEVAGLEEEFAAYTGAEYACAVSSCTTALHLALLAAGVGEGSEVITVSHSFIATANSILYCGGHPVFIDIEPETYNIDSLLIDQAITERTAAILCVHQLGMPCDLSAVIEIGRKHNLPVIEDAACAIGSEILWNGKWEKIGKPHGDAACFSFHPRKLLTTGDGGMITTNHPEMDRRFRLLRQHGMSVPDTVRHASNNVIFPSYDVAGYNYRMTDIQASIGRVQLERIPRMVKRRRMQVQRYMEGLEALPSIGLPHEPEWARSNWQSFCVRLPDGCDQIEVMEWMLEDGISTRNGVMCAHREPAYSRVDWTPGSTLEQSEKIQDTAIVLPLFHQMSGDEQDAVVESLIRACGG